MKRLTMKDENGCFLTDKTATVTWNSLIGENRYRGEAVDRLAWNTRAPILRAEEMEMLEGMEK